MNLQAFQGRKASEIGAVCSTGAPLRIEAIVVQPDTLVRANAGEIATRAVNHRLTAGGPIGCGPNGL